MEIHQLNRFLWGCILFSATIATTVIEIPMDDTASSTCPGFKEVKFNDEVELYSSGKTSSGFHSVFLKASGAAPTDCEYRYLCVAVKNLKMSKCVAKISLSGKKFEENDDTEEIGCEKYSANSWCTMADILQVTVTETQSYSVDDKRDYAFNMTVYSQCSDTPNNSGASTNLMGDDYVPEDIKDAVHEARVVGIIVAVCMAGIFLVALFISFMYYKNKGSGGYSSQE